VVTGGIGVQRGGGRDRPTGGNGDGVPVSQMGQLSLTVKPEYQRRGPYERYVETRYKDNSKDITGQKGKPVSMLANYFRATLPEHIKIFQYHVEFKPYIENKTL